MSAATIGKHARRDTAVNGQDRRRHWNGWPRRRQQAPAPAQAPAAAEAPQAAGPSGDHPYPGQQAFAGASLPGQPGRRPPWDTAQFPALHPADAEHEAVTGRLPGEPPATTTTGEPRQYVASPPAAVPPDAILRVAPPGRPCRDIRLYTSPVFHGIRRWEDGRVVAGIGIGKHADGTEFIIDAPPEWLDALRAFAPQARDAAVYGRVTPQRDTAAPEPEPEAEPDTWTAAVNADDDASTASAVPEPEAITHARQVLARAETLPPPEDDLGAETLSGAVASLRLSLKLHQDVRTSVVPPVWLYSDLDTSDRDAALERLAWETGEYVKALVKATALYRDEATAAWLSGTHAEVPVTVPVPGADSAGAGGENEAAAYVAGQAGGAE